MKLLYHLTSPAPVIADTDAVFQEVSSLCARFEAKSINLYPLPFPSRWFPPGMLGLHKLRQLKTLDAAIDLHHVYHPMPLIFPALRGLRKPIVYSVIAGLDSARALPAAELLQVPAAWVVSSKPDARRLLDAGARKCHVVQPGLDAAGFEQIPTPPQGPPFTILAGSAPWIPAQFRQKGFDILLAACARRSDIRLVLLWRGRLEKQLHRAIAEFGVADKVEVINRRVNVAECLAGCHAAAVLASHPRLVKAFPHSLVEALFAGRPVLISSCIPMAGYITEHGCGETVQNLTHCDFDAALAGLMARYESAAKSARESGLRDFSTEKMFATYQTIYEESGHAHFS